MARQPRSKWSPDQLTVALMKEQNKFIHLDPVPNFNQRNDIKPWLQKIFFPQGIDLVIERSDSAKVIFKCKSPHSKSRRIANSNNNNNDNNNNDNNICETKKFSCPFRIRATYSIRLKKWKVLVVNNVHSHDLEFDPQSDEYKKFKRFLINENDLTTLKEFEQMEYKSKLKLPLIPEVISCDCGMTTEIKLGNLILPQPQIAKCTLKSNRVNKKKILKNNTDTIINDKILNGVKIENEQDLVVADGSDGYELSNFLDNEMPMNQTFSLEDKVDSIENIDNNNNNTNGVINLNEIDFTEMFMTHPTTNKNDDTIANNKKSYTNAFNIPVENNNYNTTNNNIMAIKTPYGNTYNDNITLDFDTDDTLDMNKDDSRQIFDDLLSNPQTEITTSNSLMPSTNKYWLPPHPLEFGEIYSDINLEDNINDIFINNNYNNNKMNYQKNQTKTNQIPDVHPTPPLDPIIEHGYVDPNFLDLVNEFNLQ